MQIARQEIIERERERESNIHLHAFNNRIHRVKSIWNQQKDSIFIRDENHFTPLHAASDGGALETVQFLLEKDNENVCLQSRDKFGATPFLRASWSGHVNIMRYLSDKYNVSIHLASLWKSSPLHYASEYGHCEAVMFLLSRQADPISLNEEGETPFDVAADSANINLATISSLSSSSLLSLSAISLLNTEKGEYPINLYVKEKVRTLLRLHLQKQMEPFIRIAVLRKKILNDVAGEELGEEILAEIGNMDMDMLFDISDTARKLWICAGK